MTTLICSTRTKSDTRFTASSLAVFHVLRGSALDLARRIDDGGQPTVDELILCRSIQPEASNNPDERVAGGHGVAIRYPSGHIKHVFAD